MKKKKEDGYINLLPSSTAVAVLCRIMNEKLHNFARKFTLLLIVKYINVFRITTACIFF